MSEFLNNDFINKHARCNDPTLGHDLWAFLLVGLARIPLRRIGPQKSPFQGKAHLGYFFRPSRSTMRVRNGAVTLILKIHNETLKSAVTTAVATADHDHR